MSTDMQERFYTLQEVADKLKVNYRSVYRWVHEGKLGAYQLETQWRVPESDLQEFLKERRHDRREE